MYPLKVLYWDISKFTNGIRRKRGSKFRVHAERKLFQIYSDFSKWEQQCSERFLSKLELESRKVHNTKIIAG